MSAVWRRPKWQLPATFDPALAQAKRSDGSAGMGVGTGVLSGRLRSPRPLFWVRVAIVTFVATLGLLGCESSTDVPACNSLAVSPSLTRIMYWGRVEPEHDEPNKGVPIGDIRLPLWYADDRIFVATARLDHGVLVSGIFDVSIDPSTSRYASLHALRFPSYIWAFDYLPASGDFLITYPVSPNQPVAVRAVVVGDDLQVSETIFDSSWWPAAARAIPGGEDAIVYCLGDSGHGPGFYQTFANGVLADSLVLGASLSYSDGLSFDVVGSDIYYGSTIGDPSSPHVLLAKKDLTGGPPVVVADFPGTFAGLCASQDGAHVLVSRINAPGETPGSRILLVDSDTGSETLLDFRTVECGYYNAASPSWSPSGSQCAFIANHFSGESGEGPQELWAKRIVGFR